MRGNEVAEQFLYEQSEYGRSVPAIESADWLALYNGSIEACGALGPGSIPGAGPTLFPGDFE